MPVTKIQKLEKALKQERLKEELRAINRKKKVDMAKKQIRKRAKQNKNEIERVVERELMF